MTYLPCRSWITLVETKGIFLLMSIAVPLDLKLKWEWNIWPTQPLRNRLWSWFFKWVSCRKATSVPRLFKWANTLPRFTAPFRPLQFHVVYWTRLSPLTVLEFKVELVMILNNHWHNTRTEWEIRTQPASREREQNKQKQQKHRNSKITSIQK